MKVVLTHRVLHHWRTPVFRRLAAWPGIDFLALHGCDFPGTKTVNGRDLSGFAHREIPTWRVISAVSERREVALPFWPTLVWHLAAERPDVILAEGGANILNNFPLFAFALVTRTPVVWWTLGELQHPEPLSWAQRLFRATVRAMERRATALLGYSSMAMEYFDRYGFPKAKQFLAVNVIDTDLVAKQRDASAQRSAELRRELGLTGKKVILFVGSIAPYKRVDDLISVYGRLRRRHSDLRLLIVGDGGIRPKLEAHARAVGAEDALFTGEVVEGVAAYFGLGDVLVLPGLGGLAIAEAMTHGLPILATQADGTERDLIEEGRNGYLLSAGDPDRMESLLDEMLADPEQMARMGAHSRWLIENRYNIDAYMRGLVAALEYAAGSAARGPQ